MNTIANCVKALLLHMNSGEEGCEQWRKKRLDADLHRKPQDVT